MLENDTFDFAFTFAGEDRVLVKGVYDKLTKLGYKVFYDKAYQAELLGSDLYRELRDLYKNKGKYIVCFISENYAKKIWTNLEFTGIKERLMASFFASDFLIPIIIDNAKMLDDIPTFIGFYNHESIEKTVEILIKKFDSSTREDILMQNIRNFLDYLCTTIDEYLTTHNIMHKFIEMREIEINKINQNINYIFSEDADGQMPCILITKKSESSIIEYSNQNKFPSFIITWKNHDGLQFSIHEFDSNNFNDLTNLSLNETIKYLKTTIEESALEV